MRKGGIARHSFIERVIGTLALREEMFAEVIGDPDARQHAIRALVVGSIGPAIGAAYAYGLVALPFFFVFGLIFWTVVGAAMYALGTRLFDTVGTTRNMAGFARGIAFAGLPRVALVFAFNETLLFILGGLTLIWALAAAVLVIRASLRLTTMRATGTAVTGALLAVVLTSLAINIGLALA